MLWRSLRKNNSNGMEIGVARSCTGTILVTAKEPAAHARCASRLPAYKSHRLPQCLAHANPQSPQQPRQTSTMRREGRQHGWVFAVDRSMVDPEGKSRTRAVQVESAAAANGGFVKAPRKPTNHSKPAVGRVYKDLIGKGQGAGSGRGRHKFKHDEVKTYYLEDEVQGADDAFFDAMQELYY